MLDQKVTGLLAEGFSLITPTRRLSRHISYRYAAMQISLDKTCWETPDILPWNAWILRLWEEMVIAGNIELHLLSQEQQLQLWRDVILESEFSKKILQPANAAKQAMQAWQLCQQWCLTIFPENIFLNQDAFVFKKWAEEYQQRCGTNNWVDESLLPGYLLKNVQTNTTPEKIALLGFDELTPQQTALLEHLGTMGHSINILKVKNRNQSVITRAYNDKNSEITAAAVWARNIVEALPGDTVGIVVPDLHARSEHLRHGFNEVFHPDAISTQGEKLQGFSIALGKPLYRYGIIDIALTILDLCQPVWSLTALGKLLRSPFIADTDSELHSRAYFDAFLRKNCESKVTLERIRYLVKTLKQGSSTIPEKFIDSCRKLDERRTEFSGLKSCYEWVSLFTEVLKIFGWPGSRPLNSDEFQSVEEWQNLLGKFIAMDCLKGTINFREAIKLLRELAINQRFQPETVETPVQILGIAGAAGMAFDHLWIMGLQEESWPPVANPNPFIPVALQREAGLADASVDNKFKETWLLTGQLINSSPEVVLSYPTVDADRKLRPSPLIKPYLSASQEVEVKNGYQNYAEIIFQSRKLEIIDDTYAPKISDGKIVNGGSGLFKDMAACPYRAYARHRLHAEGLDSKDTGPDARDRGLIIHTLMENLWKQIGDHQSLISKPDSVLTGIIEKAVMQTISSYQQQLPQAFTPRYMKLEQERLQELAETWMNLEMQREPFKVIASEQWHKFNMNGLEINIRLDRIDQLADGRFIIIDYKTGSQDPKIKTWFDKRPEEPQLPLYAVNTEGEIAAILFAKLTRGDLNFIGLAQSENLVPSVKNKVDIKTDWEVMLSNWKTVLQQLADSYRSGYALVDPKDNNTCRYCDLHSLCRITESGIDQTVPESET